MLSNFRMEVCITYFREPFLALQVGLRGGTLAEKMGVTLELKRKRAVTEERRAEQAIEAPVAMAEYVQARHALLERMVQLRAERLKRMNGDNNGRKQTGR
jgi:hypothetical protein